MNEAARPESSRTVLIALLAVCLIAVAAVLFLVLRPEPAPPETVVEVVEAAAPAALEPCYSRNCCPSTMSRNKPSWATRPS